MSSVKVLNLSSGLEATEKAEDTSSVVTIKGFASVSRLDRDREIVDDPREFDIKTFMASPTLLMNHKFIADEFGNDNTAGVVTATVPAYVAEIEGETIKVHSLEDNQFVDSLSLKIAPNLKVGDRGLFIRADVRHPLAKQKVLTGEMGGLSWRGWTRKFQSVCDGQPCKVIRNVDLIEISLVHHPNQPQSTFMLAKSLDGEVRFSNEELDKYPVYGMRFDKNRYPSAKTVRAYMEAKSLDISQLDEDENSYVAYLATPAKFEVEKSISISVGETELISAPERSSDELIGVHVGNLKTNPVNEEKQMADQPQAEPVKTETAKRLRLYLLNEQGLLDRFPGLLTQSMKSVVTTDGEEIEILTLELPKDEPAAEPAKNVEPVVEANTAELKSELAALKDQLSEMKGLLEIRTAEKTDPAPEPVTESVADPASELDLIKSELEAQTAKYADVEKQNQELRDTLKSLVDRFNKQIPAHAARDERLEPAQKSVADENPIDIVGRVVSRTFFNV